MTFSAFAAFALFAGLEILILASQGAVIFGWTLVGVLFFVISIVIVEAVRRRD